MFRPGVHVGAAGERAHEHATQLRARRLRLVGFTQRAPARLPGWTRCTSSETEAGSEMRKLNARGVELQRRDPRGRAGLRRGRRGVTSACSASDRPAGRVIGVPVPGRPCRRRRRWRPAAGRSGGGGGGGGGQPPASPAVPTHPSWVSSPHPSASASASMSALQQQLEGLLSSAHASRRCPAPAPSGPTRAAERAGGRDRRVLAAADDQVDAQSIAGGDRRCAWRTRTICGAADDSVCGGRARDARCCCARRAARSTSAAAARRS